MSNLKNDAKDSHGNRMKSYEQVTDIKLVQRMPIIIRNDGCHFHTYTKGCKRPFDNDLILAFREAVLNVAKSLEGCVFAYHQSDEISFLLHGYKTIETMPLFDNRLQKLTSVIASTVTAHFNRTEFAKAKTKPATFDARVFCVPENDVNNYFYWRQKDCRRNLIASLAQSLFSPKQLNKKSGKEMIEMCLNEKGVSWDDLPNHIKYGTSFRKDFLDENGRAKWQAHLDAPSFKDDPNFINELLISEV